MSRHRLYQNYDFQSELDDNGGQQFSEEEEDDELSPEDRIQMNEGTAEVKRALGPRADEVTTKQIQDSLWHYYYDVDKSVAYLINKFLDPAPTSKPAAKSKSTAQKGPPLADGTQLSISSLPVDLPWPIGVSEADIRTRGPPTHRTSSLAHFFADMPWGNIPEARRTVFIKPRAPSGGLLGGSSAGPKASKLASLAAARKRKAGESTVVLLPKNEDKQAATSKSQLDKSPQKAPGNTAPKRAKTDVKDVTNKEDTIPKDYAKMDSAEPSATPFAGCQADGGSDEKPSSYMAKPSAFAQVLCFKSASETPKPNLQPAYHPPWMAFTTPEALREAFEQPSPDDVVLSAQSQGSRFSGPSRQ